MKLSTRYASCCLLWVITVAPAAAQAERLLTQPAPVVSYAPGSHAPGSQAAGSDSLSPAAYSFADLYRLSTEAQRGFAKVGAGVPSKLGAGAPAPNDVLGAPGLTGPAMRPRADALTGLSRLPEKSMAVITETDESGSVDGLSLLSGLAVVAFIVLRRAVRSS